MTPYAQRFFGADELGMFAQIRTIVEKLPDLDLGVDEGGERIVLSCHILARAFTKFYPLACEDGYFTPGYRHSWLRTLNRNIIDVYPVATLGGPIMMDDSPMRHTPARRLYKKSPKCVRDLEKRESFKRAVDAVVQAIRQVLLDLATGSRPSQE